MKLTKQKLIKILHTIREENDCDCIFQELEDELAYKNGDLTITTKEVHGGCEGAGEDHWVILEINNAGEITYWKIPGWYSSYGDGATLEIDNIYPVQPVKKTVTVWE